MKNLKLIGTGSFSKVYELDKKTVLIKSTCWSKECISLFVTGSMFPKIEKLDYQLYKVKYYPRVKSLKNSLLPSEYKIYLELRRLFNDLQYPLKNHENYFYLREKFQTIKSKKAKNQLLNCLDDLINYGPDICFEISPRNIAIDKGKLILLDVFFFASQLHKTRTK